MTLTVRLLFCVLFIAILFKSQCQLLDSVQTDIKVKIKLKTRLIFTGAYYSHNEDQILILQPYSNVKRSVSSSPTNNIIFRNYNYSEMDKLQLYKKSWLGGLGKGFVIGGSIGAFVGLASSSPNSFFGPAASAILGGLIFAPIGGLIGAASKAGFAKFYEFNARSGSWSSVDNEGLTKKITTLTDKPKQRLFFLAGFGNSSEVIHMGVRYYLNDFNDLSVNGSFILSATKGFGIDYRRSFGKAQISDKGTWFSVFGLSYKRDEGYGPRGQESTNYISFSFGRNLYFTPDSGLSVDIGYDHSTKNNLFEDRLSSYFGPRFQFFF